MASIKQSINALSSKVNQIAKSSGEPKVLATQEVKAAYKAGTITRAQRDILTRAISDASNSGSMVIAQLKKYVKVFDRADVNKNGRSEKSERVTAVQNYDNWSVIANNPTRSQADKDAAKALIVTTDVVAASGKTIQVPVYGVGPLLEKLDKLMPEPTLAEKYAGFVNKDIARAARDGKITVADAQRIVGSYSWRDHAEFTTLLGDRKMKFDPGAKKVIKDYLSGPLPESAPTA